MSIERFIPHAAALALAVCTTAGLLGSVDRIAAHEQHRAAAELMAEGQPMLDGLRVAEVQHVEIIGVQRVEIGVQHVEVNAHRQHVLVTAHRPA
jgi:hypothetical protein